MDIRVFLSGLQIFVIGATAGSVGMLVAQYYLAFGPGRESPTVLRARHQAEIVAYEQIYEEFISTLISVQRAGAVDISALDRYRARIELRGTPELRQLILQFVEASPAEREGFDISLFRDAIHNHIVMLCLDSP